MLIQTLELELCSELAVVRENGLAPDLELFGGHRRVALPREDLDEARSATPTGLGEHVPLRVREADDQVLRRAAVDVATALHQDLGVDAFDPAVAATEPTAKREKHQPLVLLLRAGNNEERALLRLDDLGRVAVLRDGGAAIAVGRRLLAVELRLVAVGDGLEHRVASSGSAECRERVG